MPPIHTERRRDWEQSIPFTFQGHIPNDPTLPSGPQSRFLLPPNDPRNHCLRMEGSTDRAEPSRAHHPEGATSELCGTWDWAFTISFVVLQTQAQRGNAPCKPSRTTVRSLRRGSVERVGPKIKSTSEAVVKLTPQEDLMALGGQHKATGIV